MPKTITYRPELIRLISDSRLGSYKTVFPAVDDAELVGAYLWNAHVCSALYPLLGVAEVTLRNAINASIQAAKGSFWWSSAKLHYRSHVPGTPPPDSVQKVRDNFASAHSKVRRDKFARYNIAGHSPTHHETLAKTEFSTWEFLLDREFMGPNLIWPRLLGQVFTGHWHGRKPGDQLDHARNLIKTVREFRNRLFHHEPAWKRFGVSNEQDAMAVLREKLARIEELIALVAPAKVELIKKIGLLDAAARACTTQELHRFQYKAATHSPASMQELAHLAGRCRAGNEIAQIQIVAHGGDKFLIVPHS